MATIKTLAISPEMVKLKSNCKPCNGQQICTERVNFHMGEVMNNNRKSQHNFIHVIFGKSSAALSSLSMTVSRRLNVRFNLAKTVLLFLLILLALSIISGSVFAMAISIAIGTAICGVNVFPSSTNKEGAEKQENDHNYGSNGSNGSDGSTGS
ncbi:MULTISPECIES: hypothetical protein [Pantoea]|uniref:hypothetical protein n=1 Tax=Pantoea TaxID=53335 RepID=UPI00222361D5|nr:hypothetical protein [Pantoea dispersa]UYV56932.1 hypothetical protein OH655_16020 [Pantoea dispersa]